MPLRTHLDQHVFEALPRLAVCIYRCPWLMLRDVQNPNGLSGVLGRVRFNPQPLRVEMSTEPDQPRPEVISRVVMEVLNANDAKGGILYADDQMTAFLVCDSRDVAGDVIAFGACDGVPEALELLPFAGSRLLGEPRQQVLV
jgi:hypothetical protein